MRSADVKKAVDVLVEGKRQASANELAVELMQPDRQLIWPAVLDTEMSSAMRDLPTPSERSRRPGYFASRLILAIYQRNVPLARQLADSIIASTPRSFGSNSFDSELHAQLALAYAAKGDARRTLEEANDRWSCFRSGPTRCVAPRISI